MTPVDEQPPEVGVLALVEQVDAGLDAHLGAGIDQPASCSSVRQSKS
jgi:hypothetical protein